MTWRSHQPTLLSSGPSTWHYQHTLAMLARTDSLAVLRPWWIASPSRCSIADVTSVVSECHSSTLTRTIVSRWTVPLNGSSGAVPATCAGGLALPAEQHVACAFVVPESPLAIAVNSVACLFILLDVVAMVFIWRRRKVRRGIIQRSQPPFLILIAGGAIPA